MNYLFNCFLLMIPVLLGNIILIKKLPPHFRSEIFWKDIPWVLAYGENFSRMIVMLLPLLMPLSLGTLHQKAGLAVYGIGLVCYFASWTVLIVSPSGWWSMSAMGYVAPALTPLLWLIGVGMIGARLYVNVKYEQWYYHAASIVFVVHHCVHAWLIYLRNAKASGSS